MRTTIDMAREAEATRYVNRHYPDRPTHTFTVDQLAQFVALVRADERARMCEQFKECSSEKSTSNEANRSAVLGKGKQAN
jgi:hypothetical protein